MDALTFVKKARANQEEILKLLPDAGLTSLDVYDKLIKALEKKSPIYLNGTPEVGSTTPSSCVP